MIVRELKYCLDCGKCSGGCPVSPVSNPRRAIRDYLHSGDYEELYRKFWYCTLCELCRVRCPAGVDYPRFVRAKRAEFFSKYFGSYPASVREMNSSVDETMNVFGMEGEDRMMWTYEVEDLVSDRIGKRAPIAYFVGCTASSMISLEGIPSSFTRILHKLGVDYTVLGADEWCCGDPLIVCQGRDSDPRVSELIKGNVSSLSDLGVRTLVTACAGCYRVFKLEYPQILGHPLDFRVLHTSEFLAEMIDAGRLSIQRKADKPITYHDPCELGRAAGVFEAPRKVLEYAAGENFVEVDMNREQTKCCGAGGLFSTVHPKIALDIAKSKLNDFYDVEATVCVTGCPACELNLTNAVRETNSDLKIVDIVEFLSPLIE
ncbi:MAG: (Fe-S)-binding protein [Candidatus Bathyarchaeia archaeon]